MALLTSSVKTKILYFRSARTVSNHHERKEFVGAGLAPPAVAPPLTLSLAKDFNRTTCPLEFEMEPQGGHEDGSAIGVISGMDGVLQTEGGENSAPGMKRIKTFQNVFP